MIEWRGKGTALGPRGSMIGQSSILSLSWLGPHASRPPYIHTCHRHRPYQAASVPTLKSSFFKRRQKHPSSTPAASPRSARPRTMRVVSSHRWEGRGLPSLETASKWITGMPLIIFRAYQLRFTSNRHSVTLWKAQLLKCEVLLLLLLIM